MSEPCEHQRDEAAWIWAQQLRFVADERDAANIRLNRVGALHVQDGDFCHEDGFVWPCLTVRAITEPAP